MPQRKNPPPSPKEQFKRFLDTAKEHGVEEDAGKVERAFRKLASSTDQKKGSRKAE